MGVQALCQKMPLTPFDPIPRAILFDLDDTLCDYSSARAARLRLAFSRHRDPERERWSERALDNLVAESIRMHPHGAEHFPELFARHGIGDRSAAEAAARWYRANRFHALGYFHESEAVLQAVRRADEEYALGHRPIGIITNGPLEVQSAKVDLLGLRDLVDFVLISEEFGAAKPDRRIFDAALYLAGVPASEAVFIGDSPDHDIAGAHAAGIPSVWISGPGSAWNARVPAPHRVVKRVGEVPDLVGSARSFDHIQSPGPVGAE